MVVSSPEELVRDSLGKKALGKSWIVNVRALRFLAALLEGNLAFDEGRRRGVVRLEFQAGKFPFSGAFLGHCEMRVLGYLRRYFG